MSQVVGLPNNAYNLSPIRRGFAPGCVNYKKVRTRLTAAGDKAYQLLAHGRWFSPSTPAFSTTKIDIAESGVKTPKIKIKSNQTFKENCYVIFEIIIENYSSILEHDVVPGSIEMLSQTFKNHIHCNGRLQVMRSECL